MPVHMEELDIKETINMSLNSLMYPSKLFFCIFLELSHLLDDYPRVSEDLAVCNP